MEPMGSERHRWASRKAEVSGRERVNTVSSGSRRVDDIKVAPLDEILWSQSSTSRTTFANSPRNMTSAINRFVQLSGANRDAEEGNKKLSPMLVF